MSNKNFFEKIKKEYNKRELICVILAVALTMAVGAYAWFSSNGLRYFFGVKPVTQAYTLYLSDEDDNIPLEMRTKIPPNINSKQEVFFKVKSRLNDSDVANETIKYELEMAYTENMPVNFELYKYDSGSDNYVYLSNYTTDITNERQTQAYTDNGYVLNDVNQFNKGMYRQYSDVTLKPYFEMGETPDVFKIVITWDRDRVHNPADLIEYNKETDLIYVVAREISTSQ